MKRFSMMLVLTLLLASLAASAQAPRGVPTDFTEALYENGLSEPTAMAFAPDGRLFVLQQSGAVRVISAAGNLLPAPFYSFTVNDDGERGLLGLAFDPDFGSNNYVYFYVTQNDDTGTRNKVIRLTASGNTAVGASEFTVLQLPYLSATNHNGGAIHFGLDGKLYVAVGENANTALSQSMTTRMGKILRYNADGTIPSDNPFYSITSGQNRSIWALGLRNPYTFAVQPGSGTIFINDVGGGLFEEINLGVAGENYGWPDTEGYHANPSYANPLYAYSSNNGDNNGACAITGGAFYNQSVALFPASYVGDYFFSDFCTSIINVRDVGGAVTQFATSTLGGSIVDLQVGPDGALYYLSRGAGSVYRIGFNAPPADGELLTNPSFDDDANNDNKPDGWTFTPGLSVKVLCDVGCAVRVKYGMGGGKLLQSISGASLVTGTDLDVSATLSGNNVPTGTKLKFKLKTVNGSEGYNLSMPIGTFVSQTLTLPTITTDAPGKRLKIFLSYPIAGGKVYVEEVSVFATAP
jgi:glucose/arabinose dehydrogenase